MDDFGNSRLSDASFSRGGRSMIVNEGRYTALVLSYLKGRRYGDDVMLYQDMYACFFTHLFSM